MERLIDANALLKAINKFPYGYRGMIESEIENQPTVDAVPVRHGKWILDEFGTRCSACGSYAYRDKFDKPWESPYCPICGARMDEE